MLRNLAFMGCEMCRNFFTKLPIATLRATLGLNASQLQPIINQVATVQQSNPSLDLECMQAW